VTNDDKGRHRRLEQAYERLGTRDPRCSLAGCKETDPFALTGTDPDIVCLAHEATGRGVTAIQLQHPQGRHNARDTAPMPVNDHAVWDAEKRDWPKETLCNPDGSPLRKAAASVRTIMDWFRVFIERTVGWVPAFLEWLDGCLVTLHGGCWWTGPGFGWEGPVA
jgi:hypothetical protein